MAKSDYSPLFVAPTFRNGLQYSHSDFKRFISDDVATLYKNFVNFSPVTPVFKIGKTYTPSSISSLATLHHCYTLRGSVLSLLGWLLLMFV